MTTLKRFWPLGAVLAAFALGLLLRGGAPSAPGDGGQDPRTATALTRWTCAMHPQIILPDNDRQCPICFMDLIPLEEDQGGGLAPGDLRLSEAAVALAEVATRRVERMDVARELRLVGKIVADETLVRTITARVGGRLDRLHVDATGESVGAGEALAEIYSPRLYTAAAELRAAAATAAARPGDTHAAATLTAARERLRLLGLSSAQIDDLQAGGTPAELVTVTAPLGGVVVERRATLGAYVKTGETLYTIADLSRVWVTLAAFEADLPWLRTGQTVSFTTRARPGRTFDGEISFIEPVLDESSRTVAVRVAVDNSGGQLKPGMLVSGVVAAGAADDSADLPLVIPATAPLLTGTRAVVYVKLPDTDEPVFRGREVVLGPRSGDWYVVAAGLQEGEEVVVRGAFKIDSALQIMARPSMMNPEGAGGGGGHHHGDAASTPTADPVPDKPLAVTACLQDALATLVGAYLPLQAALAGDDDAAAHEAALILDKRLRVVDCADESPTAAAAWAGLRAGLADITSAVVAADGIATRRLAFEPLSDGLWTVLKRFDLGGVPPVRRFHCPMAMDGAGANWLQGDATTANPYYGAAMLRCGSQVDMLGAESDTSGEG